VKQDIEKERAHHRAVVSDLEACLREQRQANLNLSMTLHGVNNEARILRAQVDTLGWLYGQIVAGRVFVLGRDDLVVSARKLRRLSPLYRQQLKKKRQSGRANT